MLFHEPEENKPLTTSQNTLLQELDQEAQFFKQQRQHLEKQRALLDLEHHEIKQRLSELEISYALVDALWKQLDIRETILASEYEIVRATGKRSGQHIRHQ
ncbi:hypothetical protein KDA_63100 [Dictyobacter alpinus]|uniref:Uncharacterized protein n=1 Tax=Dictyobacter alpinus TaxID=2014873 RepID=A0A402BHL0_9CHLR|nr:hypothetical protein [Dictyobacter alpinus]GCE30826.1 hypothetical protein KDA_63100 [Dictyobacter alpinus]